MSKTYNIRGRYLVNKEFQIHAIRLVLFQALITFIFVAGIFYLDRNNNLQVTSESIFIKVSIAMGLGFLFQAVLAFILSHRAAGPMHRLKNYLASIAEGSSPRQIRFRQHDQFKDVQDSYNEMVILLEKERKNDMRIIEQLEDAINNLKKMAKDEEISRMADYIERLNQDLKNFKTR